MVDVPMDPSPVDKQSASESEATKEQPTSDPGNAVTGRINNQMPPGTEAY